MSYLVSVDLAGAFADAMLQGRGFATRRDVSQRGALGTLASGDAI